MVTFKKQDSSCQLFLEVFIYIFKTSYADMLCQTNKLCLVLVIISAHYIK